MRDDLFMITCAARTGSTFLQSKLASHPEILMHGEVYPPQFVSSLLGRYGAQIRDPDLNAALTQYRDRNQTAFLYKYVFDAQGRARVGMKLKHEELLLPQFAETREAIRRDTDIKIIHLYRRNLLQRFVSWWIVNHMTGLTQITREEDRPQLAKFALPIAACQDDFDRTLANYQLFEGVFRDHAVHRIVYEDFAGPAEAEHLAQALAFLGVSAMPLNSKLKKVNQRPMREILTNYDELQAHFRGGPYAEFFDE